MAEIRTGTPHVAHDAPSHTPGINEGNRAGAYEEQAGHHEDGRSTAARSTGVRARDREPVVPGAPNLSPP